MKIPLKTREDQLKATDPRASAFVSANAGSGKTYVLTRRVIRLLLAGVEPGRILCLTFTKAAAAEMAGRIFEELGRWATLPDVALAAVIADLEGQPVTPERLQPARRLFALALETPGGLKVQTIHAFAEALLQRFALEANLDGRFTVLDPRKAADLFAEARAELYAGCAAHPETPEGQAFSRLVRTVSEQTLDEALAAFVREREDFRDWLLGHDSLDAALAALPAALGVPVGATRASLNAAVIAESEFQGAELSRLIAVLDGASKTMRDAADALRAALVATDADARRQLWRGVFLTAKLEPRKGGFTAAVAKAVADVNERFAREAARLVAIEKALTALDMADRTADLARLADRMIGLVATRKARLGALDFDDMIERAAALLSRSDAAHWVQYKLDEGLDHVLVDEAQDTSPRQWQIVEALTGEFYAGAGARGGARTLFAVGDEKQSIYSFQGAAPHLFGEARARFTERLTAARRPVHNLRLTLSFRSTAAVIGAVDKVFAAPAAHAGLASDAGAPTHETVRGDEPGLVELWPAVEKPERSPEPAWEAPVDATGAATPAVRLAGRIADEIAGWLERGETVAATGEPIRPGDILILVRKRGAFVDAMNRFLKARSIPVAGADRLDVVGHIISQDLLAAARTALLPEDDLTLATLARSPLVGLGEEALFALAYGRDGSLWSQVRRRAGAGDADAERLRAVVATLMRRADRGEPFAFFSRLVGPDGGRAVYRARFGREADEVIDEFLDLTLSYEGEEVAGLGGFIERLALAGDPIRRELDAGRNEVRVMTVHGSKGLEAPVVFLIDAGDAAASDANLPDILRLGDGLGAPLVWRQGGLRPDALAAEAERFVAAQAAEYRRLLYVGLTRARDRLVIAGIKGWDKGADSRWHGLVESALRDEAEAVRDGDGAIIAWRWWRGGAPEAAIPPVRPRPLAPPPLPDWLTRPLPATPADEAVRPSQALGASDTVDAAASARGLAVHKLLELLPAVPPDERRVRANAFLRRRLPELAAAETDDLAGSVIALMTRPDLAGLFSEAGRAEAAVVGELVAADGRPISVSGQVDRLLVGADDVLIVDYKTARHPPATAPAAYVLQLALYRAVLAGLWPTKPVRAALLWTETSRLDLIAAADLDAALAAYLARPAET
jgi:ATP-dependent helicase/nuclease subunit A